jgi:hypothetical protein
MHVQLGGGGGGGGGAPPSTVPPDTRFHSLVLSREISVKLTISAECFGIFFSCYGFTPVIAASP